MDGHPQRGQAQVVLSALVTGTGGLVMDRQGMVGAAQRGSCAWVHASNRDRDLVGTTVPTSWSGPRSGRELEQAPGGRGRSARGARIVAPIMVIT
jgi:hypothetical protein